MRGPGLRIVELFQPPDGGVPEHVRQLAEEIAARGHVIAVAGPADASVRTAVEAAGVRYRPLPIVGDMVAPRADAAALRAVAGTLRAERPSLIHAHGQKAGLLGRSAAIALGIPSVYTPHSFVYRSQLRRPRRSARARYRATLAIERYLGRRSAAITACAQEEQRTAIADRLAPPDRVRVVYSGVAPDLDAEPHQALVAFRGEGPLIGMVAGLRDQKGLPTLLDALEELVRERRAPRFAIVGNGELRDWVERQIEERGLAETTVLLPFDDRVEHYLRALDAFVLPSYWEGLPIAILEAMALGLPVVATAVDGTPEAVTDGVTGILVPARDSSALAAAIAAIAADPKDRRRMGAAGRAVALDRFGIPRMADEMLAVYQAVASRQPLPDLCS